jgi:hypothetical protein
VKALKEDPELIKDILGDIKLHFDIQRDPETMFATGITIQNEYTEE